MNKQCFSSGEQPDFWVRLRAVALPLLALAIGIWLFYMAQRAQSRKREIVLWALFVLYVLITLLVMVIVTLGGLANQWLTCGLS